MENISLRKLKRDSAKSLLEGLQLYAGGLEQNLGTQQSLLFFDTVVQLDTLQRIFRKFRNKLESSRTVYTLTLEPREAVILLFSCSYTEKYVENVHDKLTASTTKNILDQKLKSMRFGFTHLVQYNLASYQLQLSNQ